MSAIYYYYFEESLSIFVFAVRAYAGKKSLIELVSTKVVNFWRTCDGEHTNDSSKK